MIQREGTIVEYSPQGYNIGKYNNDINTISPYHNVNSGTTSGDKLKNMEEKIEAIKIYRMTRVKKTIIGLHISNISRQ